MKKTSTRSRAKNPVDAIALLEADHEKVRGLLSELASTTERAAKKREQLLEKIEKEVKVHTTIEEEIFYPAFLEAAKKKEDKKLFFEANEEHHVVDLVLPEVKSTSPDTEQFSAKAKVLKELIEHHAEEEEKEMFPRAKKLFSAGELRELAERMTERKEELEGELERGKGNGYARRGREDELSAMR